MTNSILVRSQQLFEAVIFDLDGTLLDSLTDIANAANEVLVANHRAPLPVERYRTFVGDGVATLMERLIPETSEDASLRAACAASFAVNYEQQWNKTSKPYEGITELLNSLAFRGMNMAVLSNKPDSFTHRCVSHFFPTIRFVLVVGHSDRFPKKPDPTSSLWIARSLGIAADRIAYVGDTNTDMKTAVSAGFFAMGVAWGFRSRDELYRSGARVVYDHPRELLDGLLRC
jgi:phosphoglycolate phosphatase